MKTLKLAGITEQNSEKISTLLTESCGYWSHYMTFLGKKGAYPPIVNGEDTAKTAIAGMAITSVITSPWYKSVLRRYEEDDAFMITLQDFVSYSTLSRVEMSS